MGRFGNGASLEDVARMAGCSEGAVKNYTNRCFEANSERRFQVRAELLAVQETAATDDLFRGAIIKLMVYKER